MRRLLPSIGIVAFLLATAPVFAAPRDVPHPFMLWTKEEAAAIRTRVETEPWAKAELAKEFPPVQDYPAEPCAKNLFRYLVLGDKQAAEVEKQTLTSFVGHSMSRKDDFDWQWHHADTYQFALRYDALYDLLTPAERKAIEDTFRSLGRFGIEDEYLRGFSHYGRHIGEILLALPLRDPRLIRGVFTCKGGVKEFFDDLADGHFDRASSGRTGFALGELLLWCQSCERLGLDDIGYGYTGANGGSMRKLLEGYALSAWPRTDIPERRPFYGKVTLAGGWLEPQWRSLGVADARAAERLRAQVFDNPFVPAPVFGSGSGTPPRWIPADHAAIYAGDRSVERMGMPLVLEFAHRKWPDAGFDYFLSLMRPLDSQTYTPSLYWGLSPIDAKSVKAPPAPCGVYEQAGFALLRADESPAYWESPAPAAALRGAADSGSVGDAMALLGLHAFNRPLYTKLASSRSQYETTWSPGARGHNTVIVDDLQFDTRIVQDRYERYARWPQTVGQVPSRHAFDPLVKFTAFRVKPTEIQVPDPRTGQPQKKTLEVYPGVDMERGLFLTREYLLDVFRVASEKPRQYHWMVHALGEAQLEQPGDWNPTDDLNKDLRDTSGDDSTVVDAAGKERKVRGSGAPSGFTYKDQRAYAAGARTWSVSAVQTKPAGATGLLPAAWYDRKVGVRVTLLGEAGTTAYLANPVELFYAGRSRHTDPDADAAVLDDGIVGLKADAPKPAAPPAVNGKGGEGPSEVPLVNAETGAVTIVAARQAAATTFVALHEPFEGGRAKIDDFRKIAQTDNAVAVAVVGLPNSGVNDRVMLRLGDDPQQPVTVAAEGGDGERFTFADRAFVRMTAEKVEVTGGLTAMRVRVRGTPNLIVNGKEVIATVAAGFLTFGPG